MSKPIPVVYLKEGKEKSVLGFHPWVYSGALAGAKLHFRDGSLVALHSAADTFLAYGFWDAKSQIRCRLFHFARTPDPSRKEFWNKRWETIWRTKLGILPERTTGFRFLFGEADGFPGVVVDIYGKLAVFQWKTAADESFKTFLIQFLRAKGMTSILEKLEPKGKSEKAGIVSHFGPIEDHWFEELGLSFLCWVREGQKTGFFLDQRENRKLVERYAKDKIVLNAFSYTGGFSLFALRAGAKQITSVDIDEKALLICQQQVQRNFPKLNSDCHLTIAADCFTFLRKELKENVFDFVILDPPAFSKREDSVSQAAKGYKEINRLVIQKIKPLGILFTFSCSQHISWDLFQKILFGAAKDVGRSIRVLHRLGQAPDHGFSLFHPEGEYLKGFVIQVDSLGDSHDSGRLSS